MKTNLCICGIIVMLALGGGCLSSGNDTTIAGKPIHVSVTQHHFDGSHRIIVVLNTGERDVLAYTPLVLYSKKITEAISLIQSEIAKGSEGKIELRGKGYDPDNDDYRFIIRTLVVNNHPPVDF